MLTHPMARMVTDAKIVHCGGDFKTMARPVQV